MVKQKDPEICGKRMEKTTREKITVQHKEINQKVLAKRREIKEISTKAKTIQTKQNIPKQRKKIPPTTGRA